MLQAGVASVSHGEDNEYMTFPSDEEEDEPLTEEDEPLTEEDEPLTEDSL
jgi:hypothetical protein